MYTATPGSETHDKLALLAVIGAAGIGARKDIDIEVPNLTGRRVVLTGGSDGIGLGTAKRLPAAGAELLLPVRNPDRLVDVEATALLD